MFSISRFLRRKQSCIAGIHSTRYWNSIATFRSAVGQVWYARHSNCFHIVCEIRAFFQVSLAIELQDCVIAGLTSASFDLWEHFDRCRAQHRSWSYLVSSASRTIPQFCKLFSQNLEQHHRLRIWLLAFEHGAFREMQCIVTLFRPRMHGTTRFLPREHDSHYRDWFMSNLRRLDWACEFLFRDLIDCELLFQTIPREEIASQSFLLRRTKGISDPSHSTKRASTKDHLIGSIEVQWAKWKGKIITVECNVNTLNNDSLFRALMRQKAGNSDLQEGWESQTMLQGSQDASTIAYELHWE